ncbi:hypothetical protein [Thermus scotoductus]|uniref:hypothetical protein n=1 Tax=Thermus scotoductus TaxID=37636 RepID=UPI00068C1DDE|nr:hypothetical protein [Thermus scotoductus]
MEEHQTPPSILPLPLDELVPLLQAWLQARLPAPERKPGRPRTFSDTSLLLFHLVRALLGFSSERMRREEVTLAPPAEREGGRPEEAGVGP